MPSTYSTSLRLELMATGEKSNTWGTITNTNLGTLIESAIAGISAVVHDDSANYTLTSSNGADDEARHARLHVTGTLTADRNLVCPSATKEYFVYNNTTGGFDITIKTSGGTGVIVPNGKAKHVWCDGTNVIDAVTDISSTVTVGESLIVSADGTNTLTNKTISLTDNTLTGTTAEFNTALSDDNFVTLSGTETLTNKTLTQPIISTISNTGVITLPTTTTTLIGASTTDTFTNKTINLTSNTLTGTTAQFNTALSDGSFATLAGTETLTNKTVNLTSNTLTGTTAQFNTALSDGSFATLAGSETLTNKAISTGSTIGSTVTGTTQSANDNSTKMATTAYVDTAVGAITGASGSPVQIITDTFSTRTGIAATSLDNTIPQVTQGTQVCSVGITATVSTSTFLIEAVIQGSHTTNGESLIAHVHVDGAADATAATVCGVGNAPRLVCFPLFATYAPGDTSAHTITLRVGESAAGGFVNGSDTGDLLSTSGPSCSLRVTEILA